MYSAIGLVSTVITGARHSRNARTPITTTAHSRNVIATPKRPSRRLPASSCAEPGIRMLRPTSHHARFVMTAGDACSG